MPRRTVTVNPLWATTRRRMDETEDLSRLGGTHDVLHLARAFFAGIPPQDLIYHSKERYVAIEHMVPSGRTLLLELAAGTFGDSGPTRDVMTGETEHTRGRHHSAAMGLLHGQVNRPGFHAVFRCEDSPGGGSGGAA